MKKLFILCFILIGSRAHSQIIAPENLTEINAVLYYDGIDHDTTYHKLNLVIPTDAEDPPLLVWIGGGAWSYVDRNMEMDIARKIATEGIAVASVGHRLSPATWRDPSLNTGIKHPEHIKDIAKAIRFLHTNAHKYGYSGTKIFVGGYSSGGHLAALVTMDGKYLLQEGLSKNQIAGVIPISGTYDIHHYYQVLSEANGNEFANNHIGSVFGLTMENFEDASPTSFIDSLPAAMLLISDTNTYRYTRLFEDRLREAGYDKLDVIHVHRLNHGELWRDLSFSEQSMYRDMIIHFIKNTPVV